MLVNFFNKISISEQDENSAGETIIIANINKENNVCKIRVPVEKNLSKKI